MICVSSNQQASDREMFCNTTLPEGTINLFHPVSWWVSRRERALMIQSIYLTFPKKRSP